MVKWPGKERCRKTTPEYSPLLGGGMVTTLEYPSLLGGGMDTSSEYPPLLGGGLDTSEGRPATGEGELRYC